MVSSSAEKKQLLLSALEKGMVMVHVDSRRTGVKVPPHLLGQAHLRLNLSFKFDPPDLSVNDWGVRCTLSFGASRFSCAVPWNALFAINSYITQEFWMFPEDLPQELLQGMTERADTVFAPPSAPPGPPPRTPRPMFQALEGGARKAPRATGRGHLRVVK